LLLTLQDGASATFQAPYVIPVDALLKDDVLFASLTLTEHHRQELGLVVNDLVTKFG